MSRTSRRRADQQPRGTGRRGAVSYRKLTLGNVTAKYTLKAFREWKLDQAC